MSSFVLVTLPGITCRAAESHALTTADVESFLDGLVAYQIEREDIAGAVIAVVKDGQVLFTKGYGYADVAKKKPVSADATLFRPGSISKLFVWTSVMQLVEQGKLDLERDVNDYLDFRIPATFGKPLTLRHIMTHTPGFEEAIKDLFVPNAGGLQPLGTYLRTHIPKQIFEPGTTPAYSNYATSLAGYIVERASGLPFETYVERNIFSPLNMTRCTFRQPLPDALKPLMSTGYARASKGGKEYEFVGAYPAGSSAVTATDMTKFMIAHLQDGEFNGAHILKSETAQFMHRRQLALVPAMNGIALGFYEESRNGRRIIGHGGDTVYFHSDLHLIPEEHLGFFVSYNSAGTGETNPRGALWQKFLDRYLPNPAPDPPTISSAKADAAGVVGPYLGSRRPDTTLLALINPFAETEVAADADGNLSTGAHGLDGSAKKYHEIAPKVYQEVNGQDRLGFFRDSRGRLLVLPEVQIVDLQRVTGLEGKKLNQVLAIFGLGVVVLALLLWPVAAAVRWHYGRKLELTPRLRRLRLVSRMACALFLAAGLWLAWITAKISQPWAFSSSLDGSFRVFQLLALLAALLSLGAMVNAVYTLRARAWWFTKVQECAVALACLALVWMLVHGHAFNPDLTY